MASERDYQRRIVGNLMFDLRYNRRRSALFDILRYPPVHPLDKVLAIEDSLAMGLIDQAQLKQPAMEVEASAFGLTERELNLSLVGYFVSQFTSTGKKLKAWKSAVAAHNEHQLIHSAWVFGQSAKVWAEADGPTFEKLVARHFRQSGWAVKMIGGAGDGGVDLIIERGPKRLVVQCKAHRKPQSPAVVRELYGALAHSNASGAILATLNGITPAAREWISGKPISVMTLRHFLPQQTQSD